MCFLEKNATIFELARLDGEKDDSEWYGPFNGLLNHAFPVEEDYVVVSRNLNHSTSQLFLSLGAIDILSSF